MRVRPLKGVFVSEHREVIEEYDMERLGNTNAVALSCWKLPSTGLTTTALASKL